MAEAAAQLGAAWIWLDFLSMDQVDAAGDMEKQLQICIMKDIYQNASSVVTMIGGVANVQGVGSSTGWIDRAWTLQEALVNPRQTWVYVRWPKLTASTSVADNTGKIYPLTPVAGCPDTRLIRLRVLLDMADAKFSTPYSDVKVLDGLFSTGSSRAGLEVPRHALRAALHPDRNVSAAGIWRSMFLRSSSQPVDIVYSVMGAFKLQVDPFRSVRSYEDLFYDLARKVAAIHKIGPAWFTIAGIRGSKMPRSTDSRILPECPNVKPNKKPVYSKKWVGDFVDTSADYIDRFDIKFVTHSHPHIINARMFPISHFKVINPRKNIAKMQLRRNTGRCYYHAPKLGADWQRAQAVYVGRVGNSKIGAPAQYPGGRYLLFTQWDKGKGRWSVLGDGVFVTKPGRRFHPPSDRWIFTVGNGAQNEIRRWLHNGKGLLDSRHHHFKYHSYGVVPLDDFDGHRPSDTPDDRPIDWFGFKSEKVPPTEWKKHHVHFDITGIKPSQLNIRLNYPIPLYLVSSRTERPDYVTSQTTAKLTQMGELEMVYTYSQWKKSICAVLSRAGIQGITIPDSGGSGRSTGHYYVSLQFGRYAVYLRTKPHQDTRWEYYQIVAIPYRRKGRPILNDAFVVSPPPPQLPSPLLPPQPQSISQDLYVAERNRERLAAAQWNRERLAAAQRAAAAQLLQYQYLCTWCGAQRMMCGCC